MCRRWRCWAFLVRNAALSMSGCKTVHIKPINTSVSCIAYPLLPTPHRLSHLFTTTVDFALIAQLLRYTVCSASSQQIYDLYSSDNLTKTMCSFNTLHQCMESSNCLYFVQSMLLRTADIELYKVYTVQCIPLNRIPLNCITRLIA